MKKETTQKFNKWLLPLIFFTVLSTPFASRAAKKEGPKIATVKQQLVSETLYYNGTISPIGNVPVISPTMGVVKDIYFTYGQIVHKGDKLIATQSKKLENEYNNAKVAYLKALEAFQKVKEWQTGTEMSNARDSLIKARRSYNEAFNTYSENQHLYKLGIIARQNLTQSKTTYENALMSLKQSKASFNMTAKKGKGDNLIVTRLQLDNARTKFLELEKQMKETTVYAPATGIILEPKNFEGKGDKKTAGKIVVGSTISFEQVIMTIGNLNGIRVTINVPEININQIKPGQKAVITGPGFPDVSLHGEVTSVAAQASSSGGGSLPTFDAEIKVKSIKKEDEDTIRSGMSAQIALTVYKKTDALVIPVQAVFKGEEDKSLVNLYDSDSKKTTQTEVSTGTVTVNEVQILSGLSLGQKVMLPQSEEKE